MFPVVGSVMNTHVGEKVYKLEFYEEICQGIGNVGVWDRLCLLLIKNYIELRIKL